MYISINECIKNRLDSNPGFWADYYQTRSSILNWLKDNNIKYNIYTDEGIAKLETVVLENENDYLHFKLLWK